MKTFIVVATLSLCSFAHAARSLHFSAADSMSLSNLLIQIGVSDISARGVSVYSVNSVRCQQTLEKISCEMQTVGFSAKKIIANGRFAESLTALILNEAEKSILESGEEVKIPGVSCYVSGDQRDAHCSVSAN